jgi:hypothetical protein
MRRHSLIALFVALTPLLTPAVSLADVVQVEVLGTVEFNQFRSGPFVGVPSGAPASITFLVDSDVFLNSPSFPTRGYTIDQSSFVFAAGSASTGLANPFPPGETPYFVIRNDDPAVDGFLVSTSVDQPFGVPLPIPGATLNYLTTLADDTFLPSLDILDAVGTYSIAQISVFDWSVNIGPGTPMGMIFDTITISVVPAPGIGTLALLACAMAWRRRRA